VTVLLGVPLGLITILVRQVLVGSQLYWVGICLPSVAVTIFPLGPYVKSSTITFAEVSGLGAVELTDCVFHFLRSDVARSGRGKTVIVAVFGRGIIASGTRQ